MLCLQGVAVETVQHEAMLAKQTHEALMTVLDQKISQLNGTITTMQVGVKML
jgi:TolA-binding protein